MEWSQIFELIDPRLFIVVAACWILGGVFKKTPKVPDWSIVYIVVIAAVIMTGFTLGWGVESFVQGILAGAFAVFGHQVVKQAKIGADKDVDA